VQFDSRLGDPQVRSRLSPGTSLTAHPASVKRWPASSR
jgi:hypothetical protein